jgi:hypothetical protein
MKKIVFLVIFSLIIYSLAFAQSRPIMGYDQVAWGASVDNVRRAYNLRNNVALQENYSNDPNIAALVEENVSDIIESRIFLFNRWRGNYQLYRVWVTYRDTSDSTSQQLRSMLQNRFGNITGSSNPQGVSDKGPFTQRITRFGNYSPDLDVELVLTNQTLILTSAGTVYPGVVTADFIDDIFTGARFRRTGEQFFLGEERRLEICYTWTSFRNEYIARMSGR